jgi:hypothetical protein
VVALLALVQVLVAGAVSNWTFSVWPGYGAVMASFGSAVLAVVMVFQAEFPATEQASSVVVALLALVQAFSSGRV